MNINNFPSVDLVLWYMYIFISITLNTFHLMFILTGDGSEPQDPAGAPVKTRQGARGYQKIAGKVLLN